MSFVTETEEVIEELAEWGFQAVLDIVKELMPDGKPFFMEPKTEEENLEEYFVVRSNSEAWAKWMAEQTAAIILELQDSGVDPDMILSVHPADIAQKMALAWSAEMEELLTKEPYNALLPASGTMAESGGEVLSTGTSGQSSIRY